MTKRTGHIESETDETIFDQPIVVEMDSDGFTLHHRDQSLQRLIDSGIVTATDSVITWREGHLEHVAALYAGDPARALRDYADDLTVALAADDGNFAALVERARTDG